MTSIDQTEDKYVKLIYRRIIILASAAHFCLYRYICTHQVYILLLYTISQVCAFILLWGRAWKEDTTAWR